MRMSRCCLWCRGSVFGLVCMPSCHCSADSAAGQAGAHAAPAALRWRGAPGWPRARARLRGAAPGAAGAGMLSPAGSPAAAPASGANTSAASAPSPAATSSRSRETGSLNTRGLPTSNACTRLTLGRHGIRVRATHASFIGVICWCAGADAGQGINAGPRWPNQQGRALWRLGRRTRAASAGRACGNSGKSVGRARPPGPTGMAGTQWLTSASGPCGRSAGSAGRWLYLYAWRARGGRSGGRHFARAGAAHRHRQQAAPWSSGKHRMRSERLRAREALLCGGLAASPDSQLWRAGSNTGTTIGHALPLRRTPTTGLIETCR